MKKTKIHIKFLFIQHYYKSNRIVDIAIITNDYKYIEYELEFRQKHITVYVANRIRNLFADFIIDSTTDVCFYENIKFDEPLYVYLQLLAQHIRFNMHKVNVTQMTRQICKVHNLVGTRKASSITSWHMLKAWNKMCERNICQWITKQYADYLYLQSKTFQRRKILLRFGAYYMVIKAHLKKKHHNNHKKISNIIEFNQKEITQYGKT